MAATTHAVDFLALAKRPAIPGVCVVFGEERYLKQLVLVELRRAVLGDEDDSFSETRLDGSQAGLSDVLDALATRSLFGGGTRRLVIVAAADDFVQRNRGELERFVTSGKSSGVLLLDVSRWPSNTRLYKLLAGQGLQIDCSTPTPAKRRNWLVARAKREHQARLGSEDAELLIEIVGPEIGVLDQELLKLSTIAGAGQSITAAMIGELAGGGRAKTAWEMLDAALASQSSKALQQLDHLLLAGENEIAILAQISSSLRRLAAACQLIQQGGRRMAPRQALEQAGVRGFVLGKSETQLRRLGRNRASKLYRWLLDADLDLKGRSTLPPRMILERLLLRISEPSLDPRPARSASATS